MTDSSWSQIWLRSHVTASRSPGARRRPPHHRRDLVHRRRLPHHRLESAPPLFGSSRRCDEFQMSLDRLINILVTITLIEMMVLIGLRVTFAEIAGTVRNWRLVARAAAANYVLVPVAAIALLI